MHETTIHVRWGELDPYNHVNHAVYSSYLEHARVAALGSIGHALDDLTTAGLQVVVVRSDVRFLAPATAGDTLTVMTSVAKLAGASMVWHQEIHRGGTPILSADITAATISSSGRPVRIPDGLRAALAHLG